MAESLQLQIYMSYYSIENKYSKPYYRYSFAYNSDWHHPSSTTGVTRNLWMVNLYYNENTYSDIKVELLPLISICLRESLTHSLKGFFGVCVCVCVCLGVRACVRARVHVCPPICLSQVPCLYYCIWLLITLSIYPSIIPGYNKI